MTNPSHQLWDCDKCSQTYSSPVDLTWPPQHRCGGQLARHLRDFKLADTRVDIPRTMAKLPERKS